MIKIYGLLCYEDLFVLCRLRGNYWVPLVSHRDGEEEEEFYRNLGQSLFRKVDDEHMSYMKKLNFPIVGSIVRNMFEFNSTFEQVPFDELEYKRGVEELIKKLETV